MKGESGAFFNAVESGGTQVGGVRFLVEVSFSHYITPVVMKRAQDLF